MKQLNDWKKKHKSFTPKAIVLLLRRIAFFLMHLALYEFFSVIMKHELIHISGQMSCSNQKDSR